MAGLSYLPDPIFWNVFLFFFFRYNYIYLANCILGIVSSIVPIWVSCVQFPSTLLLFCVGLEVLPLFLLHDYLQPSTMTVVSIAIVTMLRPGWLLVWSWWGDVYERKMS